MMKKKKKKKKKKEEEEEEEEKEVQMLTFSDRWVRKHDSKCLGETIRWGER